MEKSKCNYEITEVCPHCDNEITMQWNVQELGYRAFCPVCGCRLMLCSACHDDTGNCDYDQENDTCKFNQNIHRLMQCPWKAKTTSIVKDGTTITKTEFMDCGYFSCPFYKPEEIHGSLFVPAGCKRVNERNK